MRSPPSGPRPTGRRCCSRRPRTRSRRPRASHDRRGLAPGGQPVPRRPGNLHEGVLMRPFVLYHADCPDGFCAAWVARRRFGAGADYLPVQYGQEPPAAANDKDRPLYVVDFSYPRDVTFRLAALRHAEMIVLDHHKTARTALDGLETELASRNCGDAL